MCVFHPSSLRTLWILWRVCGNHLTHPPARASPRPPPLLLVPLPLVVFPLQERVSSKCLPAIADRGIIIEDAAIVVEYIEAR